MTLELLAYLQIKIGFYNHRSKRGGVYKVKETKLAGDLPLSKDNLRNLIFVKPDTVFSQELVTASEEFITNTLGNEGYAFAEVSGVPEILEDEQAVNLTFFVEPGQRTMSEE